MSCIIRPWQRSDARALSAALSDPAILNNLRDGLPYPYTEADALDYIQAMRDADPNTTFVYAIEVDGTVVGSISANRQENIHSRTAEVGYYLARSHWGAGVMTDAVRQLCQTLFAETDLLRLYAEPFSYNTSSRRVLEKAGFQLEGILKNGGFKNGKSLDVALYALTRDPCRYPVRRLSAEEIPAALALIWEVFSAFEAPEYPPEGIATFRASLHDQERLRALHFYGAFDRGTLVGVLCMRAPQHIGGFFVRADHHRRGIGRALFEAMRQDYPVQVFTVHSSPYAVPVYERLGFVATAAEQVTDGLRYTPMQCNG